MADQSPKQKILFQRQEPKQSEITNPDGTPLRDKDNADPRLKPPGVTYPAPNLAPGGAMGIRQSSQQQSLNLETPKPAQQQPRSGLSIHGGKTDPGPWIDGKIVTMPGYTFQAKMNLNKTPHGIEGGAILKLEVRKDGKPVMAYDRGWDQKPKTPEHKEALHRIRTGLGDVRHKEFKGFEQKPGKDHGLER